MKNYNNELYHYGVKGMKWGVIREENETDEEYKKRVEDEKNKYAKQVTDSERNYHEQSSSGKKVSKLLLFNGGGRTYDMARSQGDGRIKSGLKEVFDLDYNKIPAATMTVGASAVSDILTQSGTANGEVYGALIRFGASILGAFTTASLNKKSREKGEITSLQQRHLVKKAAKNQNGK